MKNPTRRGKRKTIKENAARFRANSVLEVYKKVEFERVEKEKKRVISRVVKGEDHAKYRAYLSQ